MTTKQDIVHVQLRDENRTYNPDRPKGNPQKLIARLKGSSFEIYIYEGIRESILKLLLTELHPNEDY